jgi:hypothetical protein
MKTLVRIGKGKINAGNTLISVIVADTTYNDADQLKGKGRELRWNPTDKNWYAERELIDCPVDKAERIARSLYGKLGELTIIK